MAAPWWYPRLQELAARFSSLGLTPDLASLTLAELWGVYCYLCRLGGEAS